MSKEFIDIPKQDILSSKKGGNQRDACIKWLSEGLIDFVSVRSRSPKNAETLCIFLPCDDLNTERLALLCGEEQPEGVDYDVKAKTLNHFLDGALKYDIAEVESYARVFAIHPLNTPKGDKAPNLVVISPDLMQHFGLEGLFSEVSIHQLLEGNGQDTQVAEEHDDSSSGPD